MEKPKLQTRSAWMGKAFEGPAKKIVSLVPSLTESVFMLGAEGSLVGRTQYCVRPAGKVEAVPIVGGTKNVDIEAVRALAPDVILANKEENTKAAVTKLAEDFAVLLTDPLDPDDIPALWTELGALTGKEEKARFLADEVLSARAHIELRRLYSDKKIRFVYFVWKDPWMLAGHDTYISRMLGAAGFENALPPDALRFPRMSAEEILAARAEVYFYCTEPFAFELPRDLLLSPGAVPVALPDGRFRVQGNARALIVEAERLSWYPSRAADGLRLADDLFKSLSTD